MRIQGLCAAVAGLLLLFAPVVNVSAQEVDKGKIPAEQLQASYKKLPWGCPIWDVEEAVAHLNGDGKVLWVDTRPESFFKQGTVSGAVLLSYDKKGSAGDTLTAESLAKAIGDAGLSKENAVIAFFCQGPECHRSYNASFAAVTEWGYKPEQVVWFRAGYPHLFSEVRDNAKLKRKANKYLSEAAIKQL